MKCWLALLALVLPAGPVHAADNPFARGVEDRFGISAGAFVVTVDTGVRLGSDDGGSGTDINFGDDLGFDTRRTTGRIDGYWRFAPRHQLSFGGFLLHRSAEKSIEKQIEFGDVTYDVGAKISARFQNDVVKVGYRYSFVRNDRVELSASIGLSTWIVSTKLAGEGTISTPDGSVASDRAEESKDITAPVPLLGLQGEVRLAPGWFLRGSAEYIQADIGEVEAHLGDYRVDINWFPFERFGFGAGYNWIDLMYEDVGRPNVDVDAGFDGALVYFTYVY